MLPWSQDWVTRAQLDHLYGLRVIRESDAKDTEKLVSCRRWLWPQPFSQLDSGTPGIGQKSEVHFGGTLARVIRLVEFNPLSFRSLHEGFQVFNFETNMIELMILGGDRRSIRIRSLRCIERDIGSRQILGGH